MNCTNCPRLALAEAHAQKLHWLSVANELIGFAAQAKTDEASKLIKEAAMKALEQAEYWEAKRNETV